MTTAAKVISLEGRLEKVNNTRAYAALLDSLRGELNEQQYGLAVVFGEMIERRARQGQKNFDVINYLSHLTSQPRQERALPFDITPTHTKTGSLGMYK